jgi:O-antigen/teichoic acid export membrane protein
MREDKSVNSQLSIHGNLLARNTVLNLIGQGIPLIIGVFTIPFIVKGLGTERFGLLSLAWVVLGYFAIFDLGFGRATTKFVAEAIGKGEQKEVPCLVWTSVTVQSILGIFGGLVFAVINPLLVNRVLNIPPDLIGEAKITFYLLALALPIVLITSSFRGVLEASQRFDMVNAVKVFSSSLTYLIPLIGIFLNIRFPGIVGLMLLVRFGALVVFLTLNFHLIPELKKYSGSFKLFPRLFSFGSWVMISSSVGPFLVYLDRFLIGSFLSMSAVTYYSAPYDAVTRLWIIPTSLTMTLFPAFSALEGIKDRERLSTFFASSIKYVFLGIGPVVLVIILFAKDILQIWLGSDFAVQSTIVLRLLCIGVLINSLAHTPSALLQGVGRPDLPAKFHLLELPIYFGVAWFFIRHWGIAGAAGAWTLRVAIDGILLFGVTFKFYKIYPRLLKNNGTMLLFFALIIFAGLSYVLKRLFGVLPLFAQALIVLGLFCCFALFCWRKILETSERGIIIKMVKLWKS